jgi:hypothetical protein
MVDVAGSVLESHRLLSSGIAPEPLVDDLLERPPEGRRLKDDG